MNEENKYATGQDGKEWPATQDAMVWAEAFEEHKKRNAWTLEDIDEGLMLCWFANAMQVP